jgi:hypothetical protein
MPKGDEEEIAGRGEGFFRFVALLAPRALLERPTLNPSLIRDQFRLIASVFSIKPILIWRLRAYAIYVANARVRSNRSSRRRLGSEVSRSCPSRPANRGLRDRYGRYASIRLACDPDAATPVASLETWRFALVGDGAMQMNNMAELITVQKYWKRWADPRWIVCVFNNQDLNEVTWEQRVIEGNPRFKGPHRTFPTSRTRNSERCSDSGVSSWTPRIFWRPPGKKRFQAIDRWSLRSRSIRMSFRFRRTSRSSRPRGFMSAMAKGDRGAGHIIGQTAKQVVDGLLGKD